MKYLRSMLICCATMAIASSSNGQMVFSKAIRTASATGPGGIPKSAAATNYNPVQFDVQSPGASGACRQPP
ncbi:MAG: hypothetical protein ACREJD_16260 [Phycisphaerales bacterium]